MAEPTLRPATPADAAAIAEVHVRAWQVGYRGIVADEVLAAQSVQAREREWFGWLSDGTSATSVAECGGAIVGFATIFAPSRDGDAGRRACDLAALYVAPEHWRRGVGRALMRDAMDGARADGWIEITAWVLERNDAARTFYEQLGFVPDGATDVHGRSGEPAIRLRAPLRR
jgi:GNAT superfamily N-acetyltransferase